MFLRDLWGGVGGLLRAEQFFPSQSLLGAWKNKFKPLAQLRREQERRGFLYPEEQAHSAAPVIGLFESMDVRPTASPLRKDHGILMWESFAKHERKGEGMIDYTIKNELMKNWGKCYISKMCDKCLVCLIVSTSNFIIRNKRDDIYEMLNILSEIL